ncbi:MAG: hypothetical protein ILA52_02795 [Alphaproteobacteria bacterium]|nr:hypothetical protein [Alphaproteobacteria bacterium]MBP1532406.1 hypothetical protein [Alphaproteobacteria bacterium]
MNNFVFSDLLNDMQYILHGVSYRLLLCTFVLFCCIIAVALILCVLKSFSLDLADKQDILADKYNNPYSSYDGTYELPRTNIFKAMCYANLSYHTFWNAVIMSRFRICMHKCPQVYFRVNCFSSHGFLTIRYPDVLVMMFSLSFIWGYPLFLLIMLLRMGFYSKDLY